MRSTRAELHHLLTRIAAAVEQRPTIPPEGLDAGDAAAFVSVSVSKWHSMNSAGSCPAPVELGDRCPRWLRSELNAWLRAGAPVRAKWNLMRDGALRRAG